MRFAWAAVVVAAVLGVAAGPAAAVTGDVTQLAGPAGCLSTDSRAASGGPEGACGKAGALGDPHAVVVSADGQNVYVGSSGAEEDEEDIGGEGIAVLRRDPTTGAVEPLPGRAGCISSVARDRLSGSPCTRVPGLRAFTSMVLSQDGRQLYVEGQGGIFVFARDTGTGALTLFSGRTGCLSPTGKIGSLKCTKAPLTGPSMALSNDNRTLYVGGAGLGILRRDPKSGRLRPPGGRNACLSYQGKLPGVRGTPCREVRGLGDTVQEMAISDDRKYVYAGSFKARPDGQFGGAGFAVFARDARTGLLTQLPGKAGCRYDRGVRNSAFLAGCQVSDDLEFIGPIIPLRDNRTVIIDSDLDYKRYVRGAGGALTSNSSVGRIPGFPSLMEEEGIYWFFISGATYGNSGFGYIQTYSGDAAASAPLTKLAAPGGCLTTRLGDLSTAGEAKGAPTSPPCGFARTLLGPNDSAVSPDHRNLYVTAGGFSILHGALGVYSIAP